MEAVREKTQKKAKKKSIKTEHQTTPTPSASSVEVQPEIHEIVESIPIVSETTETAEDAIVDEAIDSNDFFSENPDNDNICNLDKFLDQNKQILSTLASLNSISTQPFHIPKTQEPVEDLTPFTEEQLKGLYHNSELDILEDFTTSYIEAELKGTGLKKHSLYELLVRYLKVREKITGNNLERDQLRNEYRKLQEQLWTLDQASITGKASCRDGQTVSTTHKYQRSTLHRSSFLNLNRILGKIQTLVYENHTLYAYSMEDLRLQINLYIEDLIEHIVQLKSLENHHPVSLIMLDDNPAQICDLRTSISVLFSFERKLIRDEMFLKDTHTWLSQLVGVLLRVASYQDHLFLINHLLRCPAGVGNWGCAFIQTPLNLEADEPFADFQINHLLTILAVILSPVKARTEFLKDIIHFQTLPSENTWVVVDSDGEEDEEIGISLRENDLVAILNQLPLGDLFRCILMRNEGDINDKYMLRLFAFSSVLLKLLHQGLKTYSQSKYNQFSKRLSRFVRHVVQYTTDQWELFIKEYRPVNAATVNRLQAEYDAFFLRAIYCLYSSQKLRAWQFLAVVPYNKVTSKTLWKIYYFLHMPDEKAEDLIDFSMNGDFRTMIWQPTLRSTFEGKLSTLEDGEVYYLLNIFANMALNREENDYDFIFSCTMEILEVGFICTSTQESCSKSARILLSHLTSKYPLILSNMLSLVQENLQKIGSLSLFLYEDLPLTIWTISDEDMVIIERLLLNFGGDSDESKLGRMIVSRLNWDIQPYEKHCQMALIVLKACDQDAVFLRWAWPTILRLKLHLSDRHFNELGRVQELERCDVLLKQIRENQPLASFVSILMTTWGHLVPLICSKGLDQLMLLQQNQKHEMVLFALYQMMPIFINCQECVINCDKYQQVLTNLLNADRGYVNYAKSFIVTQNTVLQQFGNMVGTQIVNYAFYNLNSPRFLVRLWMNSFLSLPNWNKDTSVLFLLDVIIRNSFFYQDCLQIIYENFRELHQSTPQESTSIINIFKWASGSSSQSLLSGLGEYPWLAFIFLEVEHQEKEVHNGMWMEVLRELAKQKGKISVDNAIKSAATNLKLSSFTSGNLCIYRWAQQALETPIGHPLLPLLWQKFFILFLARLPEISSVGNTCVGERFFDGMVNFAFFKRIKKRLQDTIDSHKQDIENINDLTRKEFLQMRHNIFQAFLLWLEEPRLQSGNLLLQSLPIQYEPQLLGKIIEENNQSPWYAFLDQSQMLDVQSVEIKLWRMANFREKVNVNQPVVNPGRGMESGDPHERILRRLSSYDQTKPPPDLSRRRSLHFSLDLSGKEEMFKSLKPCFATLQQLAQAHILSLSEQKTLDCAYRELIPQLYTSVMKRYKAQVPCRGRNQAVLCSGPAQIELQYQEAKLNERIDHEIQVNRQTYESLLKTSLQLPPLTLHTASVSVQQCVRSLQVVVKSNPETAELGVELFYHLLSLMQEEIIHYPPAKSLFVSCIEKLGQSHVRGVEYEMPRLLDWILKYPKLGGYLAPYFVPSNSGSANMLLMYASITKQMSHKYDVIFALVSKFEIDKWLNEKRPSLSQRSQFITQLIEALSALGYEVPIEALTLHGLYRRHLLTVFEHEFPEHYGETLLGLLRTCNKEQTNLIAESVWLDVLNSLAKPVVILPKGVLRDQLRQYAQQQNRLCHQVLLETSDLLARHFTQDRLSYGLYGLYPKCRNYIDIYAALLGMTGHGLIVSMLNTHQGLLGDKMCEKIWPYLREMFMPWLVPYSTNNISMATWIQQLTDDRSTLLPWIPADGESAGKILRVFCECVQFVLDLLPASRIILSYLWQWYVSSFGHSSVKDHILQPIHKIFTNLPWNLFWPSLVDLEYMLMIMDQCLPECHSFLGHVFIQIQWEIWIKTFQESNLQVRRRMYHCFLSLLVKLSIEPNIRKRHLDKARSILIQAESFDWLCLEPMVFQHVMEWVVMSCPAGMVFKSDVLDLDYRLLCFLKLVSGYTKVWPDVHQDLMQKRQMFVKAHVKLLSIYVSRQRNQAIKETDISRLVDEYLHDFDTMVTTQEEMEQILKEILPILNITSISHISLKVILKWIENKTSGPVLKVLLSILGACVSDYKNLATLFEAVLTSYFNSNVLEADPEEPSWKEATDLTQFCISKPVDFEASLLEQGCILTLNVLVLQKVRRVSDKENLLDYCIGLMERLKVTPECQPKVPLIWFNIIALSLEVSTNDESSCGNLLHRFAQILFHISSIGPSGKWGRGLLSAIGLSTSENISINFRFICRALSGYLLAQLPEMKHLPRKVRLEANSPSAVGMPGGNGECPKILLDLDFGQSSGKIKECAEVALAKIQDPANSLHNTNQFLWFLLKQFYIKPYLKPLDIV